MNPPLLSPLYEYTGDCDNNLAEGTGSLRWLIDSTTSVNVYKGEFRKGKYHGIGILTFSGGTTFSGVFHEGVIPTNGTISWKNGKRYEGDILNFRMHGQGTLFFPNGDRFTGTFVENKRDGDGVYVWSDGIFQAATFQNDTIIVPTLIRMPSGFIVQDSLGQPNTNSSIKRRLEISHSYIAATVNFQEVYSNIIEPRIHGTGIPSGTPIRITFIITDDNEIRAFHSDLKQFELSQEVVDRTFQHITFSSAKEEGEPIFTFIELKFIAD